VSRGTKTQSRRSHDLGQAAVFAIAGRSRQPVLVDDTNEPGEPPITDGGDAIAAALESQRLMEAILITAADPIIVIDEHGTMEIVNDATTKLFGYSDDGLIGQNVSMLMPEPFRSEHDGYLENYLRTGETKIIGIGREVTARCADGSTFPISLAVSEVASQGARRFTGIIHDLRRRVTAEQDLLRANSTLEARVENRTSELRLLLVELERSNRDLEQFAYIASHDLQAPLRNVRQGLELLDEHLMDTVGSGFDDEAQELRRLIVVAVTRMEELIRGLLEFSRVDSPGEESATSVDLNDLVIELRDVLRADFADAKAELVVDDLPVVRGDRVQLRQLLQNLLQNALKYRTADAPPRVEVQAHTEGDEWIISVGDNGIGIDQAQHERIFELFRRGHAGYSGVGLGLAIAQRIVERHDGRIWVESAPDEGATFRIALPKMAT
jgi:two-component system sensor kinase FixL